MDREVVIQKVPGNPQRCRATPFEAEKDDQITFTFIGEPNAKIEFKDDTPFDTKAFDLDRDPANPNNGIKRMAVVIKPPEKKKYKYDITWSNGGGKGNGGGEVLRGF